MLMQELQEIVDFSIGLMAWDVLLEIRDRYPDSNLELNTKLNGDTLIRVITVDGTSVTVTLTTGNGN